MGNKNSKPILRQRENSKNKIYKMIDELRKESLEYYRDIKKVENNVNLMYEQYKNAINIDNTNEEIIINYMIFLHSNKSTFLNYNNELKKYHLFFDNGKRKIFEFLYKLINYNKFDLEHLIDLYQYIIREYCIIKNSLYKINLPVKTDYSNIHYWKLYETIIKDFYFKFIESKNKVTKQMIEDVKNKPITLNLQKKITNDKTGKYFDSVIKDFYEIISCDFSQIHIIHLTDFLKEINIFVEYLDDDKNKNIITSESIDLEDIDFNKPKLLDNLIYYIIHRKFDESDNPLSSKEFYLFNDSVTKRNIQIQKYSDNGVNITELDDYNVKITFKTNEIILNDKLYSIGYAATQIQKYMNFKSKLLFSKFDDENNFRKNWQKITNYIKELFNSNLMKNYFLENDLFDLFNYRNQKYLDEVLNNVYFYPFIANDFYASYSKETETIYLSGIPIKSLDSIERSITEYSFLIICLLHELFHFYFSTMRYISQNEKKFDSPTPKNGTNYAKKRGCESGEWLEEQLFGRLIKELHINESLLIFKMKEFSHMEDFRKEFLNVKTKTLNIGDFQNYFKNWIDISQFQSNIKNKEFDNNYVLRVWPTDIFDDCLRGDIFFFVPPKEQLEFIESTEKEVMKKEGDEFLKKIEQIIQNKLKKN